MDNGPAHRNQNAADWQKGKGGKKGHSLDILTICNSSEFFHFSYWLQPAGLLTFKYLFNYQLN